MIPTIPLELQLLVRQARCTNVRVVGRPTELPEFLSDGDQGEIKAGKDAPWLTYDDRSSRYIERVLEWDETRDLSTVGPSILEEVVRLVEKYSVSAESGDPTVYEKALIAFYEAHGPLIVEECRPLKYLILFRAYMAFLRTVVTIYGSTLEIFTGSPPWVTIGEESLHRWHELFDTGGKENHGSMIRGLPIHESLAMLSRDLPERFPSREAATDHLRNQAILPAVAHVLRYHATVHLAARKSGHISGALRPADPFFLAVLTFVDSLRQSGLKECACGCGQLVPPGRMYVDESHRRRANKKQAVLTKYRTQMGRGKITEAQYAAIIEALNDARSRGVTDRMQLEEAAEMALES